jgi:hypothetical protein
MSSSPLGRSALRGQNVIRAGLFVAYVAAVPVANWLVDRFGVVPVGFGLRAPAAVYLLPPRAPLARM